MLTGIENHRLRFGAEPQNITKIEPLIDAIRAEYDIDDTVYANMLVAITEAVNNAILHGNASDPNKDVEITLNKDKHTIIVTVIDQGKGFDYNNLDDPTAPENLEKPTGRGVFLMKNLADMVIFNESGNAVELHFKV